jgi:hypothetical protein
MFPLLLRVAGVGLLAWASLAAAIWQPAFLLVPFLVAWMMRACAPGSGPERWAIPLLNGLLAWVVATPTDPGTLPVRDFLNHGLVNQHLAFWHPWLWAWSVLAGWAVVSLPARWLRPTAGWILGLVIAGFLLQSALLNPAFFLGMAQDSGMGITYNDNSTYRQVYHRVVAGQAYYPAYIESFMLLRPPTDSTPAYAFGYRLPGSFLIWKYLTSGHPLGVPILFLALCAGSMVAVYRAGRCWLEPEQAVLAPVLMGPILTYGIPGWHLLMADYWAMFLFLLALPWFALGRVGPAALLLSVSTTIREFMLAPTLLFLLAGLGDARLRPRWMLGLPLASCLVVLGAHLFVVNTAFPEMAHGGAVVGYRGEGFVFLARMLHFGAPFYARWDLMLPVVFCFAFVGFWGLPWPMRILLGGHLLAFFIFAWLFGEGVRTYWAIMVLPVVMILAGWFLTARWGRPGTSFSEDRT